MKVRKEFKLTMDDRLDRHLRFYALMLDGYRDRLCFTCVHRRTEDCKLWNGSKYNESDEHYCVEYKKDLSVREDAFKTIKDFILNEYKED